MKTLFLIYTLMSIAICGLKDNGNNKLVNQIPFSEEFTEKNTTSIKDSFDILLNIQINKNEIDAIKTPLKISIIQTNQIKVYDKLLLFTGYNNFNQDVKLIFEANSSSTLKKVKLVTGEYSIVIAEKLVYHFRVTKHRQVNIEVFSKNSNLSIYGSWEYKKRNKKYNVYISPTKFYSKEENYLDNSKYGEIHWYDGCNTCGSYNFEILSEDVLKSNKDNIIQCTLLSCKKGCYLDIPKFKIIKYQKKKKRLKLTYYDKKVIKRITLRNKTFF